MVRQVDAECESLHEGAWWITKSGGEGKDLNLRVVFATEAGEPTFALANGDLSVLL